MKKLIRNLLAVFMMLAIICFVKTEIKADKTDWSDMWYYDSYGDGVKITGYNNNGAYKEIEIPSELDGYTVTAIGNEAFKGRTYLTGVSIPSSVTSIGDGAFRGCINLTEVNIPESVTSIGYNAFYGCTKLTEVSIPGSVIEIGYNVFGETIWLTNMRKINPLVIVNNILIDGRTCEGAVSIPSSVTSISDAAFYECTKLTKVSIPSSVTKVGDRAFAKCYYLSVIYVESIKTVFYGVSDYNSPYYNCPAKVVFSSDKTESESGTTGQEPATTEKEPAITEKEPATTEKEPAATEKEPATTEKEPATTEKEPATTEKEPATTEKEPATTEKEPATTEKEPATTEKEPAATEKDSKKPVLSAPKIKVQLVNILQAKLTWVKVTGAKGYYIYRSTSKNGTYKRIAKVGASAVSYVDKTCTQGKTYYYKVAAYNSSGTKKSSDVKSKKIPVIKVKSSVPVPVINSVAKSGKNIIIKWTKITKGNGYVIYRSTNNRTFVIYKVITGLGTTQFTDRDIKTGNNYYYRLAAYSGNTTTQSPLSKTNVTESKNATTGANLSKLNVESEIKRIQKIYYNEIQAGVSNGTYSSRKIRNNVTAYYDKRGNVRRIDVGKAYDNSKYSRYYYFENGRLIFAYLEGKDAHRLYYYKEQLFRWRYAKNATQSSNAVNHDLENSSDFRKWGNYALTDGRQFYRMANE